MPTFTFEAIDNDNQKVNGEVEASSKQAAINKVHDMGYVPTDISMEESSSPQAEDASKTPVEEDASSESTFSFTLGGVSSKELTQFTSQLAILMDAGLPIVRSLKVLESQMNPSTLKNITGAVAEDVEQGSSLSDAMAKHPKAFDDLYVNMIKAGEAGGVLDTILNRLAEFMEKAEALKRKVIAASIYPIAVICFAVIIVTGIMIWIIPQFKNVFDKMEAGAMPLPTRLLIDTSNWVASWGWIVILLTPVLIYIGLKLLRSNRWGRYFLDNLKLNMPLFGPIMRKSVTARFCRTFGTLTASGVPILEALGIVKGAIGNEVVKQSVQDVHDSIREGENIAEPLAATGVFDDIVINMIDVGEETGELDKMLIKIADTYEDEVDTAVEGLMSLLEPILIIGMGLLIGFIVVALFLPLVDLVQNVQQ